MLADQEELARAELYGVLATLYQAPAPAALLAQLARPPEPGLRARTATRASKEGASTILDTRWAELLERAGALPAATVADEYDALFGGVGKPDVFLHASWFLAGFLNEKPLAVLRGRLALLGLERVPGTMETEDHISSLCEVMGYLITGDDPVHCTLAVQRDFFQAHLGTWVDSLCDAIDSHPRADFYRALARLTRDFVAIESQAFDLVENGRQ